MTFLHPWALVGLLAAGIPLVLHLLTLRKLKTVEFSTLRFLKELQQTSIRRLQLKQLLLLVVRTLLIVFLVGAFSRPTIQGSIPLVLAERAKTTAVVILDDSYSMQAHDEHGVYLSQAKQAAHAILSSLKEGDEVAFLRLSECREVSEVPLPHRNSAFVRTLIDRSEPVAVYVPLAQALECAQRILTASLNYNRELYVISDFQQGLFDVTGSALQKKFPEHTNVFAVVVGTQVRRNAAVEAVELPTVIYHPKKPYTVRVTVRNTGAVALRNHSISIVQNKKRSAEKSIDIDGGQRRTVEFTLVPQASGVLSGMVVLEDDDIEFDNRAYFALTIPERVPVCVVGSPTDTRYVTTALNASLGDSLVTFEVTETRGEKLSTQHLLRAQALVLAGDDVLSTERAAIIASYVKRGHGLLYFPSISSSTYATVFASPNRVTKPGAIVPQQPSPESLPQEFRSIDFRHPIFSDMFEQYTMTGKKSGQQQTLEVPRIVRYVQLHPTPSTLVIAQLPNGAPFATDDTLGRGRCVTVAVGATPEWSDFPYRGIFVPFVHRSVLYVSQTMTSPHLAVCGSTVTIPVPLLEGKKATVTTPDGVDVTVLPQWFGNDMVLKFQQTMLPGIYTVNENKNVLRAFAVNIDPRESTVQEEVGALEKYFEPLVHSSARVHVVKTPTPLEARIMESRYGVELWSYLLILAILCAFAEILLARPWNFERDTSVRTEQ